MSETQAQTAKAPDRPRKKAGNDTEETLYAVRQKVYPRAVTGTFAAWRWTLVWLTQILFYGMPWLQWQGSEHHPQPAVVSITQSTEMGTLYSVDEIGALCDAAHAAGMLVHLDGARIANALVATGSDLPTMVRDTGVDLMTLGLTKDGAMFGETVVFVAAADDGAPLDAQARFVRKQAGQLVSKSRFVAAQVLALLEDDLWLANARHANLMAARLARSVEAIPGVRLADEPQVNSLFVHLPAAAIAPLQEWSFFWDWDLTVDLVRWMTSFATTDEDVQRFAAGVSAVLAGHA